MMKTMLLSAMALLFAAFMLFGSPAQAQCIPGIPCTVPKTDNPEPAPDENPAINPRPDGPNAAGSPNEKKTDSSTCDADFMNQIHARAFLEASRETMLNQTAIRKPDSVMEYSCFDQLLKDTADFGGPRFSESNRWQGVTVQGSQGSIPLNVFLGSDKLDTSLNSLVMQSLNAYKNSNFANDFLGGSATEQNNTIATTVQGAGNGCSFMNDIFFLAKCNNFEQDDQMMRFSELVTTDPRNVFGGTSCTSPITQPLIDVADNKDFQHVNYEPLEPRMDLIGISSTQPCADPIQTGVTVVFDAFEIGPGGNIQKSDDSEEYKDSVCSNPGCYFDGSRCLPRP